MFQIKFPQNHYLANIKKKLFTLFPTQYIVTFFITVSVIQLNTFPNIFKLIYYVSYVCSTFQNNENKRTSFSAKFQHHSGIIDTVVGFHFPMSFKGTNEFQSNYGAGMTLNHARVTVQGHMKFYNNQQGVFGGAVRLGELTLVRL